MNKQTRFLRLHGLSLKQTHASARDNAHYTVKPNTNASLTIVEAPVFRGKECITEFALREKNPMNKRKSEWRGARARPMRSRD